MKMTNEEKTLILEQYVNIAISSYKHKIEANGDIAIECIYCGSTELKGKIWHSNTGKLLYNCWRESCPASKSILASRWLKKANIGIYQEYRKALFEEDNIELLETLKKNAEKAKKDRAILEEKVLKAREELEKEDIKYFYSINSNTELAKKAVEYCKHRSIPKEVYSKFFVADYGKYYNRMIIPFYHKDGKIGCFQGRALYDTPIRYLTRIGHTELYNFDFLDKTKPIIVLEGPIDSIFIDNATATCGAGSSAKLEDIIRDLDIKYLLDNDIAGVKKSKENLKESKYVFNWPKFLLEKELPKLKDINDVFTYMKRDKRFTYKELEPYFTNNINEYMIYNKE